jgi:hypothetical protein
MMGEAKQRPCVFIDAEQGERFHVVLFTIVGLPICESGSCSVPKTDGFYWCLCRLPMNAVH